MRESSDYPSTVELLFLQCQVQVMLCFPLLKTGVFFVQAQFRVYVYSRWLHMYSIHCVCVFSYSFLIALEEAVGYPQNRKWLSIDWRCTSFELILLYSFQDVYLLLLPCLPLPPSSPPPSYTWSRDFTSVRSAPGQTWLGHHVCDGDCSVGGRGHAGIQHSHCVYLFNILSE